MFLQSIRERQQFKSRQMNTTKIISRCSHRQSILRFRARNRSGGILIAGILYIMVLFAFAALAIDIGALYQAKSNLGNAADAGSLAGAQMLRSDKATLSQIQAVARRFAELNVPGVAGIAAAQDTTVGVWDFKSRRFSPSSIGNANAVRVVVRRRNGQSKSVTLHLGAFLGVTESGVDAVAISAFEFLVDDDGVPYTSRVRVVQ